MKQGTTIKEIANRTGVHFATVSRAILNKKGVSPDMRKRILDVANELNYRPNHLARSLIRRKTHVIGFLTMGQGGHYSQITHFLQWQANQQGYSIAFSFAQPMDAKSEKAGLEMLLSQQVDGIIMHVSGAGVSLDDVKQLQESKVPVVMYEPPTDDYTRICDCVTVDWAKGTMLLVNHLLDCDCMDFAFVVSDSRFIPNKKRVDGYCLALTQAGIDFEQQTKVELEIDYARPDTPAGQYGYQGGQELLASGKPVDAFVCHNDEYAMGAMTAYHDAGVEIPEQIKFTGFDDLPQSRLATVPLTTIRQPIDEITKSLVSLLLARLSKGLSVEPINYMIQPELVVRNSTIGGEINRFGQSRVLVQSSF